MLGIGLKSFRYYITSLLTVIQDVFSTAPVLKNDVYVFEDKTGNNNDLKLESYWFRSNPAIGSGHIITTDFGTITESTIYISTYILNLFGGQFIKWCNMIIGLNSSNFATMGAGGLANSSALYPYINTKIDWAFSFKAGGLQKIYANGVLLNSTAVSTFTSFSGSQQVFCGNKIDGYIWDFQIHKVQHTDAEVLFKYNNPHKTVFDCPTFSHGYTDRKELGLLWWKMTSGQSLVITSNNIEYDCSGNNRNGGVRPNNIIYGWVLGNPYWHANQIQGCYALNSNIGLPDYYIGFDWYNKPSSYRNYLSPAILKHLPQLNKYSQCETTVQQVNLDLPDFNNFWYEENGTPKKKKFSDFDFYVNNNQLYCDKSDPLFIKNYITTDSAVESLTLQNRINKDIVKSNYILCIGDSIVGGIEDDYFDLINQHQIMSDFMWCSSFGGADSYQIADDCLGKTGVTLRMPSDIKTRYPDNPEGFWTGYDIIIPGSANTMLNTITQLWSRSMYQVINMGGNQSTNTYPVWDRGSIHYRIVPDHIRLIELNNSNPKQGCIMQTGMPVDMFPTLKAQMLELCETYGYSYIDTFSYMRNVYNILMQDSVNHPAIQKLIELDIQQKWIRVIDSKVYIWNNESARTNSFGQPVDDLNVVITEGTWQGATAKWVRIAENVPNTIINIDGVDYDTYNANSNVASVVLPRFIPNATNLINDYPNCLKRDLAHPIGFTRVLWACQLILLRDSGIRQILL